MKKAINITALVVAIVLVGIIILSSSIVIVHEDEFALIKRFNRVERIHSQSGIYLKTPFIEEVEFLPSNIVIYTMAETDVITRDRKAMTVDSYVLWQIYDPLRFTQTLTTVAEAERRIDTVVYTAIKNTIGRMDQSEVIEGRGRELREGILESIAPSFAEYGVRLIKNEIKRLDLPDDNKRAVYTRMISEREQLAAGISAEGREEAQVIRNLTNREVTIVLSEAERVSEQTRAEGEREYMRILAEAYTGTERSEFYEFIRSLDAIKVSLRGNNKTLFLPIDSPLTRILLGDQPEPIPQAPVSPASPDNTDTAP